MRFFPAVSRVAVAASLLAALPAIAQTGAQSLIRRPHPAPAAATPVPVPANPLLAAWTTPDGSPPFDRIQPADYQPAIEEGIRLEQAEIDAIANNPAAPTFENTMEAMERAGAVLDRVNNAFSTVTASHGTPEIEAADGKITPLLSRHSSAISLNEKLFQRIDALYQKRVTLGLQPDQMRLLEVSHRDFLRAGAGLKGADRARFAAISEELAKLSFEFGRMVVADQKAGDTFLTKAEVAGMPEDFQAAAAAKAKAAGKPGQFAVGATRSDFESFLTLATNRDAREKVFKAFDNRGANANANNTSAVMRKTVELRLERAKLLGYKSFADYQLVNSMAGTPDAAEALLKQVYDAGLAKAKIEQADIMKLAQRDKIRKLEPWDWRFYSEKIRQERYALDEAQLKQYLPLTGMIEALKETNQRLFGITMAERKDIPTWHPETRTFDVFEADGTRIGLFYGDWFARETKQPGAWMNAIRTQNGLTGALPQVVNNTNYTAPAAGNPALLPFDDAETLFHEFGHALHGLFSNTRYPSQAGTSVYRDFVEFPSQVYEHWVSDRGILERHARNAKGEPMPPALLDALLKARTFNQGYQTVQQLASALVDMDLHRLESIPADFDPIAFEKQTLAKYGVPEAIGMRHRMPHFTHIFSGGYAAGYYAYTWAEVLEADAFAKFEESGDIWNRDVAKSYRDNILSKGNSRPPEESYVAFRGRMPTPEALLKNRGLK